MTSTTTPEQSPASVAADPSSERCQTCDSGRTLSAQGQCCRDLRSTLGSFATGITVVTARSPAGEAIGMTISSFNSVSLEPPLILWSLSVNSPSLDAFRRASHYAVNVLSSSQSGISDRFAARAGDRFAGLSLRPGLGDAPLLADCCAWFECANELQYPGGDHVIFVGRVERFAQGENESPLIFHNGRYRQLAP